MSSTELREIGSISLLDLDIISKFNGRDFLPFPFMFTQPSRFSWHDEYVEYARSVPDRFNNGDLRIFQECAGCYANADIRVECHLQYSHADTGSIRVVGVRFEQMGFLAKQRPDEDIIDIYELSPYALGPAVAEAAALEKPGGRSAITIPEFVCVANDADNCDDINVQDAVEHEPGAARVPRDEVRALGTVQTHWRPTRQWGMDPGKKAAVWVRIKDDGEYLYAPDYSEARPMTTPVLAERIDQLITEDIKALKQFRSG